MSASNPVYTPQSLPDWNEAVEQWVVYLAAWGRRPSTLIHYGDELRRFAAWSRARGLTPYSVSPVHIDDYVVDIRIERNLGGRSIAARLTALRQFQVDGQPLVPDRRSNPVHSEPQVPQAAPTAALPRRAGRPAGTSRCG